MNVKKMGLVELEALMQNVAAQLKYLKEHTGTTAEGVTWEVREVAGAPGVYPETAITRLVEEDIVTMYKALDLRGRLEAREKAVREEPAVPYPWSDGAKKAMADLMRERETKKKGTLSVRGGPKAAYTKMVTVKAWAWPAKPTLQEVLATLPHDNNVRLVWMTHLQGKPVAGNLILRSRNRGGMSHPNPTIRWGSYKPQTCSAT